MTINVPVNLDDLVMVVMGSLLAARENEIGPAPFLVTRERRST